MLVLLDDDSRILESYQWESRTKDSSSAMGWPFIEVELET